VLHFDDIGPESPRLPDSWSRFPVEAGSAIIHAAIVLSMLAFGHSQTMDLQPRTVRPTADQQVDVPRLVFIATRSPAVGLGGGGGGGNRQAGPTRRAEGIGSDRATLRTMKSPPNVPEALAISPTETVLAATVLPAVLLEAKPLASGSVEQGGLPAGGVSFGTSMGPGSGGGVGTGSGTGIGPGIGPGLGPGSGGGVGGGVYRPGGGVSLPRVITEVRPTYTSQALLEKIQGTVVLQLVVTRDGRPSQIRVIQSLDPVGLDQQAIEAASRWRFEPSRLAGTPVDALVTIMLDFRIH
jgi:protein TonB